MSDGATLRERTQRLHEKLRAGIGTAETELLPADVWLDAAQADSGLQVTAVAASDPLLSGAFAALDRETGAVWHASDLPEPRRAAIIAHEFGHFYLHPDLQADSCGEYDAPDSLFSHYAQVAVGYSPAERRESEANQFAAEFLLPSPALRHAFRIENLAASEIAARVGVSETLVFSRLADTILGPHPPAPSHGRLFPTESARELLPLSQTWERGPGGEGRALDASQKLAAETLTGPTLVDAGPGTGKTRTLIARLCFLIGERSITSDNILALTFSNKAAGEMRDRLAEAIGEAAAQVWIGTFHAFGLEFLRKEGGMIGLPPAPGLLEDGDAALLLEQNLDRLPLNAYLNLASPALPFPDILACISRAKDELQTPEDYRRAALALMKTDAEAGAKALEIAGIYAVYQQLLTERGLLDFGDLLMRSVQLLDAFPEVKNRWQAQYPHILADEYQDVNRASAELLRRLAGAGRGFWAVGDIRQAIYRFRGASPANIRDFERDFPGGARLRLEANYRSRPGIVQLFAASASAETWQTRREICEEPEIIFAEADDADAQADGIAEEIRRREAAGVPLREQAILCRTNNQAGELARQLEARNVPAQHLGDLFERAEVRDLLALLEFCCRPHGAALRRVAQFPAYNIPEADADLLVSAAREATAPFPKALSLAADLTELSEAGRSGLLRLWKDIELIAYRGDAWIFLSRYLFETSDYLLPLLASETFAARQNLLAIRHLMAFTRNVCAKMRFVDGDAGQAAFLDYLRHLLICGEERSIKVADDADELDAARLLTAHSSKGLEFPVVYLPNVVADQFPMRRQGRMASPPPFLDPNGKPIAEEPDTDDNLFFVALSRARDALILSYPKIHADKPTKISPLLNSLQAALASESVRRVHWRTSAPLSEPDEAKPLFPVPCSLFPSFSASALEEYQTCPRRFYYRRVLQVHTGPEDSDYLKFHDATAKTAQWLASERSAGNAPTESETQARLAELWTPAETETAVTRLLRQRAAQMVETLRQTSPAKGAKPSERKFTANLPNGSVTLECDAASTTEDGTLRLQRHHRRKLNAKTDHTEPRLALLRTAAQQTGAVNVEIALVSLADGETKSVPESTRYEPARVEKYDAALAAIRAGAFDPKPGDRECPRCPYFFLCPI